jgi:hypothetical protein
MTATACRDLKTNGWQTDVQDTKLQIVKELDSVQILDHKMNIFWLHQSMVAVSVSDLSYPIHSSIHP